MLKNSVLVLSSLGLQGCFESTPTSTTQQPNTSSKKSTPLSNVSNVNFRIPEGTTCIISSYEQRETNNWSDARNWRSGFYKNGDLLACGDYNYVPCMQKKPYLPHTITISGECFVNDSVDVKSLSLRENATLIIPQGICFLSDEKLNLCWGSLIIDGVLKVPFFETMGRSKSIPSDLILSGEGTLELTDSLTYSAHVKGTITTANLLMPGIKLSPPRSSNMSERLHLNIANGCFSDLYASTIRVSNRLDVTTLYIRKGYNDNLSVNHLNIRKGGEITLESLSSPLQVQKLSFEPHAKISIRAEKVGLISDWKPESITGVLDATNMRVWHYPEFKQLEPNGSGQIIGGRVDLLIAEQGVIGTSAWLKEQNRRTIAGITNPRNSEQFPSGSTRYLLRTDDRALYATALTGAGTSLFSNDHTLQRLKHENPNTSHHEHLGLNYEQYRELNKICEALCRQAESIYENATDAGIERYLDIQLTADIKERARKVLGLIDISKYLDQQNDVNQAGLQAVSDIFAKARVTRSSFDCGLSIVEMPASCSHVAEDVGVAFNGTDTSVTLAFHNSRERNELPLLGLELNKRINVTTDWLFQSVGSNLHESNRSFTTGCGVVYKATPALHLSAVAGGSYYGGAVDSLRSDEATPISSLVSMRTDLKLLWNVDVHQFKAGFSMEYLPSQITNVKMLDFGITFDKITISDRWNKTAQLGYASAISKGAMLSGNLQFNFGAAHTLSGNIGVELNR